MIEIFYTLKEAKTLIENWLPNKTFKNMDAVENTLVDALVALEGDHIRVKGQTGFDWIVNDIMNATLKVILAVLLLDVMIFSPSWAFAQAGNIPVFVKDNSVSGLSDISPNRTINISMGSIALLEKKPEETTQSLFWETGTGKSYLIPALEIPTFLLLLNMYDRINYPNEVEDGKKTYDTTLSTFWDNLVHEPWEVDHDSFSINQFAHPYQGSMHYGFARSAGLNYWESLFYANVGSFLWEMGGETTHPSINDQIATGTGGSFLGEALFRMAGIVLEGDGNKPGIFRELSATILSPPTGINRFVFGERFKPVFPSHHPPTFWFLQFGAGLNTDLDDQGGSGTVNRYEAIGSFSMAYGLPGKTGYRYTRPFDYFNFEFVGRGNSENPLDSIMIRGLLLGSDYEFGNSYRGIWGLYGGYDYISPHIFPVASTSVSLGTTFQWWLSREVALQSSVLGGIGYAATGNVTEVSQNNYHYGVTPQGLFAFRLIFGDRAMLDFTGRAYRLTGTGGNDNERTESVDNLNMGFIVRIYDHHALGIQYILSIRNQHHPDQSDSHQTVGTVCLAYTWLGDARFGAVEWRGADSR
jgi:hypothetical protein